MSETHELSETEPLLSERESKPFNNFAVIAAILLSVGIGIGVVWLHVIPSILQREIDAGNHIMDIRNLSIAVTGIDDKKIHFDVNSRIEFMPNTVSVTAEVAENKLAIGLLKEYDDYTTIMTVGTPHYFYSTDRSVLLNFQDVLVFKNLELLSALISDICSDTMSSYSLQLLSYPKISIPGLVGSWNLKFMRSFTFYATSNLIGPLDVPYIKEYTIKRGKGEDGLPKVAISANASIYNRAPISLPLIDARLEFQIFYKNHHVLNIQISDVFLNPEGITYPLPLFVETVEWTPLQEMIYKFSEGEDVQITVKNFRFNTDHRQLKWIQGLLNGLDFPLTLPAPDSPGIFRLFDALKKAGRQ